MTTPGELYDDYLLTALARLDHVRTRWLNCPLDRYLHGAKEIYGEVRSLMQGILTSDDLNGFYWYDSNDKKYMVRIRTRLGELKKSGYVSSPGKKGGWRITLRGLYHIASRFHHKK